MAMLPKRIEVPVEVLPCTCVRWNIDYPEPAGPAWCLQLMPDCARHGEEADPVRWNYWMEPGVGTWLRNHRAQFTARPSHWTEVMRAHFDKALPVT